MAALVLSLVSLSAAISCGLVLLLIVKEGRERGFPPTTKADAEFLIYAGFLLAVLAAFAVVTKDAARDSLVKNLPGRQHPPEIVTLPVSPSTSPDFRTPSASSP